MEKLEEIARLRLEKTANEAVCVRIVSGDTKVPERVKVGRVFITTTGCFWRNSLMVVRHIRRLCQNGGRCYYCNRWIFGPTGDVRYCWLREEFRY